MEQLSFDDLEIWKPLPGYEGLYEVSSLGRVRSLDRFEQLTGPKAGIRSRRGRELSRFPMPQSPYLYVRPSRDGKPKSVPVHTLVLTAFDKPRPVGLEARHLNGDAHDNRAVNLAWGTRSENTLDQVRHGTHHEARKTHCPQGHPYDRVYETARGGLHRVCTICSSNNSRERAA